MSESKSESSRSGTTIGYKAEYRKSIEGKWEPIPTKYCYSAQGETVQGIPFPAWCGGVLQECCLMAEAQAKAVAYGYAASYEAVHFRSIEVRLVSYQIKYSFECDRKDVAAEAELTGEKQHG